MLGPLVNPSKPKQQLIGVWNLEVAKLYQDLHKEENKNCAIVHALDGYDEVSLTGDFQVFTKDEVLTFSPNQIGLDSCDASAIHGGATIEDSVQIFQNVLRGKGTKAQENVVLANAGLALYMSQGLSSYEEGVAKAKESINSGAAYASLKKFLEVVK